MTRRPVAVLDACVLAPMPVADTLLRLAEPPALYEPRWTNEIAAGAAPRHAARLALKNRFHRLLADLALQLGSHTNRSS